MHEKLGIPPYQQRLFLVNKELLGRRPNISPYQQRTFLAEKELVDAHSFSFYNIQQSSALNLELPLLDTLIFIRVLTGSSIIVPLFIFPNDTIEKIMPRIRERMGIPPALQRLYFACNQLPNQCTLESMSSIQIGMTIQLIERLPGDGMQAFVKIVNGTTIVLEVKGSYYIENIKAKIEDMEGIPHDQQMLIFHHVQLKEGQILSSYGICNESIIHVMSSLHPFILVQPWKGMTFPLQVDLSDTIGMSR